MLLLPVRKYMRKNATTAMGLKGTETALMLRDWIQSQETLQGMNIKYVLQRSVFFQQTMTSSG